MTEGKLNRGTWILRRTSVIETMPQLYFPALLQNGALDSLVSLDLRQSYAKPNLVPHSKHESPAGLITRDMRIVISR